MDLKQYKIAEFPKAPEVSLIGNLVVPSTMHSYSLCVEYIKDWFLNIIGRNFFEENSIYVDGKHLFDDFIRMSDADKLKRSKPILAIIPKLDNTYNKDNQYLKLLGVDRYIRRGSYIKGFFNDFNNNLCMNVEMKAIRMDFDLIIRLSTRAQQVDLAHFLNLACKIGWTNGEYKDMDFHVPYELMMRLAKDAGFEVKDNRVVKQMKFLRYLNTNSQVPFVYKVRGINGKREYFLRLKECYIHTRYNSLDIDDGERSGQISSNFNININLTCTFPCPSFYMYYSEYKEDIPVGVVTSKVTNAIAAYAIKITRFPDLDEHGWNLAMTTDIDERDHSKPLELDLNWLFHNDSDYNDILTVIKDCKDTYISPDIFLNFKLYNMGNPIPCNVDWEQMKLYTNTILIGDVSNFAIYIDYGYMNERLISMEDYYKERIE